MSMMVEKSIDYTDLFNSSLFRTMRCTKAEGLGRVILMLRKIKDFNNAQYTVFKFNLESDCSILSDEEIIGKIVDYYHNSIELIYLDQTKAQKALESNVSLFNII